MAVGTDGIVRSVPYISLAGPFSEFRIGKTGGNTAGGRIDVLRVQRPDKFMHESVCLFARRLFEREAVREPYAIALFDVPALDFQDQDPACGLNNDKIRLSIQECGNPKSQFVISRFVARPRFFAIRGF